MDYSNIRIDPKFIDSELHQSEDERILKNYKNIKVPLLGEPVQSPTYSVQKNYGYSEWRSKGFGKKKASLLSALSFTEYTPNNVLLKKTRVDSKNLNSLVSQTNKELAIKQYGFRIISNKRKSRKLSV